jgi:hypothetical protein
MEKVGICPICGNDVVDKGKLFACADGTSTRNEAGGFDNAGCQYKIFKSSLQKFGKEEITTEEVTTMLENGTVEVTLVSKAGKDYLADLVPDTQWGTKVAFRERV